MMKILLKSSTMVSSLPPDLSTKRIVNLRIFFVDNRAARFSASSTRGAQGVPQVIGQWMLGTAPCSLAGGALLDALRENELGPQQPGLGPRESRGKGSAGQREGRSEGLGRLFRNGGSFQGKGHPAPARCGARGSADCLRGSARCACRASFESLPYRSLRRSFQDGRSMAHRFPA